jgi:hypothetical protein
MIPKAFYDEPDGANLDRKTLLLGAGSEKDMDDWIIKIKANWRGPEEQTYLMKAAQDGRTDEVRQLCEAGADVNPLVLAVQGGEDLTLLQYLISCDNGHIDDKNPKGWNAIMFAARAASRIASEAQEKAAADAAALDAEQLLRFHAEFRRSRSSSFLMQEYDKWMQRQDRSVQELRLEQQMICFTLKADVQAAKLYPRLQAGDMRAECSVDATDELANGVQVGTDNVPALAKELFLTLVSPLQMNRSFALSTSGSTLDFRGLIRFYTSGCNDMRIWKTRTNGGECIRLRIKNHIAKEVKVSLLGSRIAMMAANNGLACHLCESIGESELEYMLSRAGVELDESNVRGTLTLEMEQKYVKEGVNYLQLALDGDSIRDTLQTIETYSPELEWSQPSLPEGFRRAPWNMREGKTKLWESTALTAVIKIVGKMSAQGITGEGEKDLTIMQLILELDRHNLRPFLIGGFIRDILVDKASDDVDLSFAASYEDVKRFAEHCERKGWTYSLNSKKQVRVADIMDDANIKEGDKIKEFFYINFGDQKKEFAVEGKIFTQGTGEGKTLAWQTCDFCCNEFLYDPIRHVLIDPSGHGVGDAIATPAVMRIPHEAENEDALIAWMNFPREFITLYRWFKFRTREYKCDERQRKWVADKFVENIGSKVLQTEFVYCMSKEIVAMQNQGAVSESERIAREFAEKFVKVIEEDVATVTGAGTEGWFHEHVLPWIPQEYKCKGKKLAVRGYFPIKGGGGGGGGEGEGVGG